MKAQIGENEIIQHDENCLLCDVANVMLENKIRLIKEKISKLADQHEYYTEISVGSGSRATEIIEERQSKLFELLDRLQGNIALRRKGVKIAKLVTPISVATFVLTVGGMACKPCTTVSSYRNSFGLISYTACYVLGGLSARI